MLKRFVFKNYQIIMTCLLFAFLVSHLEPHANQNALAEIEKLPIPSENLNFDSSVSANQVSSRQLSPDWNLGESVNTTIEFPDQIMRYPSDFSYSGYQDVASHYNHVSYTWDSNNRLIVHIDDSLDDNFITASYQGTIYAIRPGTLTYKIRIDGYSDFAGSSLDFEDWEITGTQSITEDNLHSGGYLSLFGTGYYYNLTGGAHGINLYTQDYSSTTNSLQLIESYTNTSTGWDDVDALEINIYTLRYSPNDYNEHIRTEYRYISNDTIEHRLIFENPYEDVGLTFAIPMHWNVSRDYGFTWEEAGNDIVFSEVPLGTYEFLFRSGPGFGRDTISQKQYLAIDDITSDQFKDLGFEGSWQNDWTEESANPFDSISLNTTVVFEGAFSLRLEDSDASGDYLRNLGALLDEGYYYVSLCYYVESFSGTSLSIYYYSDDWVGRVLDTSVTNRWIQDSFYFKKTDHASQSTLGTFNLDFMSAQGVVFFDDIKFWEANPSAKTSSNYPFTTLSSTLRSWDGYQNPVIPNEQVEFDLRDRTDDSSIDTFSTTTDLNGLATWEWGGRLEQKEYELRSWSYESFWNPSFPRTEKPTDSGDDWSDDTKRTMSSERVMGSYSVMYSNISAANYEPSGTWDLTNADYWVLSIKSNITMASSWGLYLMEDWSNYHYYYILANEVTTAWSELRFNILDDIGFTTGSPDISAMSFIRFNDGSNSDSCEKYFDAMRIIQSQKSYFTPSVTGELDYAMTEGSWGSDGWDFQEETEESASFGGTISHTATSGYEQMIGTGSSWGSQFYYMRIYWSENSIDASYYDTVEIRAYKNTTETLYLEVWDGSAERWSTQTFDSSGWRTFYLTDPSSDWTGTETTIIIWLKTADGNNTAFNACDWRIDYVRLSHCEDGTSGMGYCWEFEEDQDSIDSTSNPINGWYEDYSSATTATVANGYLSCSVTTNYRGIKYTLTQDWSFDYFTIRMKAGSSITMELYESGVGLIQQFSVTTEWAIYRLSLSGKTLSASDSLELETVTAGSQSFDVDWIILEETTIPSDFFYETDASFFVDSSNNSLTTRFYQDNVLNGDFQDLEIVPKNNTPGSHALSFWSWLDNDDSPDGPFLPSVGYYYEWNVWNFTQGIIDVIENVNSTLFTNIALMNSTLFTSQLLLNATLFSQIASMNDTLFTYLISGFLTIWTRINQINNSLSTLVDEINATVYENCTINDYWNQTAWNEMNTTQWNILYQLARDPNAPAQPVNPIFLFLSFLQSNLYLLLFLFCLIAIFSAILYLFWTKVVN